MIPRSRHGPGGPPRTRRPRRRRRAARAPVRMGSFASSPAWKRKFSSRTPRVAALRPGPRRPIRRSREPGAPGRPAAPRVAAQRGPGESRLGATLRPAEVRATTIARAPCVWACRRVGRAPRMRASSLTSPSCPSGTLKSTSHEDAAVSEVEVLDRALGHGRTGRPDRPGVRVLPAPPHEGDQVADAARIPHSLSYHARTLTSAPSTIDVDGPSTTEECGSPLKSTDTGARPCSRGDP